MRLDLVGKSIAVNTFGVKACFVGRLLEGNRIIPTSASGLTFHRGALEKDAESGGIVTECCGNTARKAVASRATEHEDFLWAAILFGSFSDVNFLTNFGSATLWVRGDTDKSSDAWLNNHIRSQ